MAEVGSIRVGDLVRCVHPSYEGRFSPALAVTSASPDGRWIGFVCAYPGEPKIEDGSQPNWDVAMFEKIQ